MNKWDLVQGLRSLADQLKPFAQAIQQGGRVWDGAAYVHREPKRSDGHALMWWSTLLEMAALLEAQDAEMNQKQVDHIHQKLFGGMGSFSDYSIDVSAHGDAAAAGNKRLDEERAKLFRIFSQRR